MKLKIIKIAQLENDMMWDETGLIKITGILKNAMYMDFYSTLIQMKQDPTEWDWEYEEEIDEELGIGKLTITGERINVSKKD